MGRVKGKEQGIKEERRAILGGSKNGENNKESLLKNNDNVRRETCKRK